VDRSAVRVDTPIAVDGSVAVERSAGVDSSVVAHHDKDGSHENLVTHSMNLVALSGSIRALGVRVFEVV